MAVVNLDGRPWCQVKYHDVLTGGTGSRQGLVATAAEVQDLLGTAFAELQPDQPAHDG